MTAPHNVPKEVTAEVDYGMMELHTFPIPLNRCQFCKHKPGFRVTTSITKRGGSVNPSKSPCGCECHMPVGDYPLRI